MNIYRITYNGVEYEQTAQDIEEAIAEFLRDVGHRDNRMVFLITKVELVK